MFRKVCFMALSLISGSSVSRSEGHLLTRSASLMVVASIFVAGHLRFQPHDDRNYFILDQIESATFTAVFLTALLATWLIITNDALVFQEQAADGMGAVHLPPPCAGVVVLGHVQPFRAILNWTLEPPQQWPGAGLRPRGVAYLGGRPDAYLSVVAALMRSLLGWSP